MRITRLSLRNVRRHRTLDLELDRGLTVVRGPNESGKTTIQRALELALTRKVTAGGAEMDGFRSWGGDDDEARPWLRMEFEQDEEDTVHAGVLEKSFRGAKGTVRLVYQGNEITDPTLADQTLAELTGIPTEAFFRSTASVRHHEVMDLARDEGALRDRLQASISGADRGTSRAKKKLERALYDLNTKGEKNPGRVKVAEQTVQQAQAAVDRGEASLAQLEHDRDVLSLARERRVEVESALTERRAMLEKARQAERLVAEREAARLRFERYRSAVAVDEEIQSLRSSHPSREPLPVLRGVVTRLRQLDGRIRELKAMLSGEVEVRFDIEVPEPREWRPTALAAVILILMAVLVVVADRLQLLVVPLYVTVAIAAVLLVVGVGLAILGRRQRLVALDYNRTRQLREDEIDRRLRGRSQLEHELQQTEIELANQLSGLELADVPAAEALLAAEEEHVAKLERLGAQLDGLVGKEPPETLPKLRDAAAYEVEMKTGALEELGPIAKEPRARERLEAEVADTQRALDRARDDESDARARVEQNPVDAEEVAAQAERLATWREQLVQLQRRARIYEMTLRAIESAEKATMRTATRYLEKHMVGDLALVTDGRYRRVEVDDADLGIRVFAPERGDWVDVSALSQGTLDLVYLAARIGLVRLVTGDRRPPLVLDDPFVTLDDARAARALVLLRSISRDFQVIYLTTSDRYDSVADRVCELEAPTARDLGAVAVG